MVRCRRHAVLVPLEDGGAEPFDPDALADELWRCCRAEGGAGTELAADIVRVVAHYLERALARGRALRHDEIPTLVCRVLREAGLKAAAARYRGLHPARIPAATAVLDADRDRVIALLNADPFFVDKPVAFLAAAAVTLAGRQGLTTATPAYFVELARSLWMKHEREAATDGGGWAFTPAALAALATSEQLARWTAAAVLEWQAVSRFVPVLDVTVHLARLCDAGAAAMHELSLMPTVDGLCAALAGQMPPLLHAVRCRCRDAALQPARAVVRLRGLATVGTSVLRLPPGAAERFGRELHEICAHRLGAVPDVELAVE